MSPTHWPRTAQVTPQRMPDALTAAMLDSGHACSTTSPSRVRAISRFVRACVRRGVESFVEAWASLPGAVAKVGQQF